MANVYHRGDELFLYVQFKDEKGNPVNDIVNPMVRITYEKDGTIESLIDYENLNLIQNNEYCLYTYIDDNASYALYEVEYIGEYSGSVVRVTEEFYVIPTSETYTDAVKVYGFVHQARAGYPLVSVNVQVELQTETQNDTSSGMSKIISNSYTREDGFWEAYLYPGEYTFIFNKFGFSEERISVQLGADYTEIQFDNVTLEAESDVDKGDGVFRVFDTYITREGVSLNGLTVNAFSVINPSVSIAQHVTDDSGSWELFLDPGLYILKVSGESLSDIFDQTFRLKVTQDGEFKFENLTANVAVPNSYDSNVINKMGDNDGSISVYDQVTDVNGNPLVDVQVNVYDKNNLNIIIAQDYTDPGGRWEVWLDPGTYIFEFYHPEFNEVQEERTIE